VPHNVAGRDFIRSGKLGQIGMVRAFVHYAAAPKAAEEHGPTAGTQLGLHTGVTRSRASSDHRAALHAAGSPYLAALTLAIGCAALAREMMTHDSIPDAPSIARFWRMRCCFRICSIRKRCQQESGISLSIFSCLPLPRSCSGCPGSLNLVRRT